jgi:hypothetical protein
MTKFPKAEGAVFAHKKTGEKQPDFKGKLEVTREQIEMLIQMGKSGQEPKLQVAAWNRKSQAGQTYLYLKSEAYMKEESTVTSVERFAPDDDEIPF